MKYIVEITETLQKQIEVEADTEEEAYRHTYRDYGYCDIVLDDEDFMGTEFKVFPTLPDGQADYDNILLIAK